MPGRFSGEVGTVVERKPADVHFFFRVVDKLYELILGRASGTIAVSIASSEVGRVEEYFVDDEALVGHAVAVAVQIVVCDGDLQPLGGELDGVFQLGDAEDNGFISFEPPVLCGADLERSGFLSGGDSDSGRGDGVVLAIAGCCAFKDKLHVDGFGHCLV